MWCLYFFHKFYQILSRNFKFYTKMFIYISQVQESKIFSVDFTSLTTRGKYCIHEKITLRDFLHIFTFQGPQITKNMVSNFRLSVSLSVCLLALQLKNGLTQRNQILQPLKTNRYRVGNKKKDFFYFRVKMQWFFKSIASICEGISG